MKYRELKNWKYQLTEDYIIETNITFPGCKETDLIYLEDNGKLIIRKGYAWDGATYYPDFKDIMRGSLVHDCLIQLVSEGYIDHDFRKSADDLLRTICLEDGMPRIEANLVHKAVRKYSKSKGYI